MRGTRAPGVVRGMRVVVLVAVSLVVAGWVQYKLVDWMFRLSGLAGSWQSVRSTKTDEKGRSWTVGWRQGRFVDHACHSRTDQPAAPSCPSFPGVPPNEEGIDGHVRFVTGHFDVDIIDGRATDGAVGFLFGTAVPALMSHLSPSARAFNATEQYIDDLTSSALR